MVLPLLITNDGNEAAAHVAYLTNELMGLDGAASSPEGLVKLLFGLGVEGEPKPLIEYFGDIGS